MIEISLFVVSLCFLGFLVIKGTPGQAFVNLYLINFVLQFFILDVVNQLLSGYQARTEYSYMAAAMVLSLLYVAVIWALSALPSFKRTSHAAFEALIHGGYPVARYAILLWLAFRIYLLGRYGIRSFSYMDPFEHGVGQGSPLSYAETVCLMALLYLASGAVMAFVIQLALRSYRGISLLEWSLLIVFFGFILLGEAPLGVRRTVILYAMIFLTTYAMTKNKSWKAVGIALGIGVVGIAFVQYYQQIRFNAQNPEIHRLLSSGNVSDILSGLVAYLTPGTQPGTGHGFRSGGLDYLATSIKWVEQSGRIMGGSLLTFALHMVVPSAFLSGGKPRMDIDTYVTNFFRKEETDYSANILANLYVDLGVFSIVFSPLLWWATIYMMLFILSKARTNGPLALGVSGMIFGMLSLAEGSLIALFVYMRDIFVVLPIFFLVGLVVGKSRAITEEHGAPGIGNSTPAVQSALSGAGHGSVRYPLLQAKSNRDD